MQGKMHQGCSIATGEVVGEVLDERARRCRRAEVDHLARLVQVFALLGCPGRAALGRQPALRTRQAREAAGWLVLQEHGFEVVAFVLLGTAH